MPLRRPLKWHMSTLRRCEQGHSAQSQQCAPARARSTHELPRFGTMDQVKSTLAVVGAASVATALIVLAKRTLESRRNVDAERRCVRLQAYP